MVRLVSVAPWCCGPMGENRASLDERVSRAAEAALAERSYVSAIDVLVGLGWLAPSAVDAWRQGRISDLEGVTQANLHKISTAMAAFRRWAKDRGLAPSETAYLARTRDRRPLRFSRSGVPAIEAAYRTHWVSPALSDAKRQRLAERQSRPPDLVVIVARHDFSCKACGDSGEHLIMDGPGPLCLACADLDHLVYLPAGDAALTRRAKAASALAAVVVQFSQTRKRYERQGVLVEEQALARAESECLADEEARRRRRVRDEERRQVQDEAFVASFAAEITRLFPGCPPERAEAIAAHAGLRRSGRVGRSAAGRALDPDAVTLAVVASVRHLDTSYDELLMRGVGRIEARQRVTERADAVLTSWRVAHVP